MNWTEAGQKVLNQLEESGFDSYIVGGAVRDKLIGKVVMDVDICTKATVEEIQSVFLRTIEVGIQHGTVIVPIRGFPVQVSTFKGNTLEEDLLQRDFTINAMAENRLGDIIDPLGGKKDLHKRLIRSVTNTSQPFEKDPLRLLRALRFALQFHFHIEERTQEGMNSFSHLMNSPAIERISAELEKISTCSLDGEQWTWLLDQPVFQQLNSLFQNHELKRSLKAQERPVVIQDYLTWWSFALYDEDVSLVKNGLSHYKRSNRLSKDVIAIHQSISQLKQGYCTSYDLYKLGKTRLTIALHLLNHLQQKQTDETTLLNAYDHLPIKEKKEILITGRDILDHFPSYAGHEVGQLIKDIERNVVSGQLHNEQQAILDWIRRKERNED
ncbi:CCA tRNA nucleotidyltransferase [Salipaludibacillus keqinensis]|uniref:CCA tRNA nucleotidyltransferase n=1 Tax=Salipaludibacillus keqinensis TaxID=2045207 RepID=A0A323TID0_9BACI|nr:CCA tRNA nucleotidyltransferase [Salipaludibacillus keqinensis]PYZ94539.1 CCA tRNA nucleotidyltransferase [Salipaludibacillus keqinensis]